MEKTSKVSLTANAIKIIAIIAMVIDHVTWDYIPTNTVAGQLLHTIGRLTAPIMSFFIVEGFYHTRNLKRYALRLFIFSIISYFAFQFHCFGKFFYGFETGNLFTILRNSVIFTLLLGLLTLIIWYKSDWSKWNKVWAIVVICLISIPSDWDCMVVLWIFFMGINYGNFKAQMQSLAAVGIIGTLLFIFFTDKTGMIELSSNLFQFGVVFAIPILCLYNGKRGKSMKMKWLFYIFYPLHLLILGYLHFYIIG